VVEAFVWSESAHHCGIERYAREAGWVLRSAPVHRPDLLASWKCDGIICQLHRSAKDFVAAVRGVRVPKVELAGYVDDLEAPIVKPDYRAVGRLAAEHFIDRGFRDFAFLGPTDKRPVAYDLRKGFEEHLSSIGVPTHIISTQDQESDDPYQGYDNENWRTLWSAIGGKVSDLPKPVGLLVWHIDSVVDLVEGCWELGFLIPEQVAIVSLSGVESPWIASPISVSCVELDYETQGYQAAALLDQLMDGDPPPKEPNLIPPVRLTVRESSDTVAVGHVEVAKAVSFILRNLHRKDLFVPDVVAATKMSPRGLYRVFEEHVGLPIASEIDRLRSEKAMGMLAATSRTLAEIAEACGYQDTNHLKRSVKRRTGLTPTAYRRDRQDKDRE
jgi:LacI family transcriptional regulator